jgi:hypothetical protein
MAKKKIPQIVKDIRGYQQKEMDWANEKLISYSQLSIYNECPKKWSLQYKEGHKQFTSTIHTVFGSALHLVIQHYLTVMYEQSMVEADKINTSEMFEDALREEYQIQYKKNKKQHFCTSEELREFYEDGIAIIRDFAKNKTKHFSKRGWHLVGCELPLSIRPDERYRNVILKGYIDLIMYNQEENILKIYDFKTSTRGWNDSAKKDEDKQFQIIFYKHYYSKQFGIPEDNIEVEFFILKRKIWEESEFPQSRIQIFSPASGKIKTKKAVDSMTQFIEECFEPTGGYKSTTHKINPNKNCQYCPFNDNKDLCSK